MRKHLLSILQPVLVIASPNPCSSASVRENHLTPNVADDDSSEILLKGHIGEDGTREYSFENADFSFEASTFSFELSDDSYMVVWFSIVNKSTVVPMNFKSGNASVKKFRKSQAEAAPIEAEIMNASNARNVLKAEGEYLVKESNKDFINDNLASAAISAILGFGRASVSALDRVALGVMAESSESEMEAQLKENENELKKNIKSPLSDVVLTPFASYVLTVSQPTGRSLY